MKKIFLIFGLLYAFSVFCTVQSPDINLSYNTQTTLDAPLTPVDVSAISSNGKINISWLACAGAASYTIYFSTVSGLYDQSISTTQTTYLQTVPNGTKYFYAVSASNSGGESLKSLEVSAIAGVSDNHNGTVSDFINNLTWTRCQQSDAIGNNAYDIIWDDCYGSIPMKLKPCDVNYMCDNTIVINETTMIANGTTSEAYFSCKGLSLAGGGWRLPSIAELEKLNSIYTVDIWPDIINDYHWSGSGYMDFGAAYGYGQAAYNFTNGTWFTPVSNPMPSYYVMCVK